MATNTTNLSLIKPSGTDKIRIAQINQNMDIIDEKIGQVGNTSLQAQVAAVDSGLAIVSNGNTHVAITSGQYVYIRNHSSLSEGLYKATAAIAANVALTTSNVTKLTTGSANDLKNSIDSLNSQIASQSSVGSFSNETQLNTILDTLLSAMPSGGVKVFEADCGANFDVFKASTRYFGTIYKTGSSTSYAHVDMRVMASTEEIWGRRVSTGGYLWVDIASQLATELASKQYVFGTNSSSTLAEQVLAFCGNHRGESNYTVSFFMSASNAPSDLPANSNTWKYAFGEVRIRISPLSGGIDGVIILYAFSANQMAIRYIANSVVSSEWKVFS